MEGLKRTKLSVIGGYSVNFDPNMWNHDLEHTMLDRTPLTFKGTNGFYYKFAPMCGFWLEHRYCEWLMYKTLKAQWKR